MTDQEKQDSLDDIFKEASDSFVKKFDTEVIGEVSSENLDNMTGEVELDPVAKALFQSIDQIDLGVAGLQASISILSDRLNAAEDWIFFLCSQNPKFMTVFEYARKKNNNPDKVLPDFPVEKATMPKTGNQLADSLLANMKTTKANDLSQEEKDLLFPNENTKKA
jgi:hypothetical protein